MHKQLISVTAAMVAIAAFGCGGGSSNGNTYVCNYPSTVGICSQWTSPAALTSAQISQLQGDCSMTQWGGTFSTGATCPSASRVGTCVISTQLPGVTYKWSFYSPTYTAQTGQTFCTNFSGFWTPG
ncbi:MAG TPA: hypothetical protein VKB87_13105 [Myxococcaceae bacterium]|nr:hypothetical protein [Myxococcaceae bacterium]